uniref:transcription factor E3-like n=1 Tax=Styela clava TaxID=7725 RepID=UPI001939B7D2|nr:transcription factor E3-like [Styela clava]
MSNYLRTNTKMELQRAQAEAQRKKSLNHQSNKTTQSQAILLPNAVATSASVPGTVLHVQSNLQHPTRYHVEQKQRNQVANYLSNSVGTSKVVVNQLLRPHGSMPDTKTIGVTGTSGLSAPASPLSRLQLSTSADSQMDDIIDDIVSLESSLGDRNLSTTLPTIDQSTLQTFAVSSAQKLAVYDQNKTSSSCPPEIIPKQEFLDDDPRATYMQDRVKKDNHNRIERRRRYNINDRIKELGTLVPRNNDPDMRWNKGSILKASVDYMRDLQNRVSRAEKVERNQGQMQNTNRRLMLRIQELEMLVKSKGMDIPPMQEQEEIFNSLLNTDTSVSFDDPTQMFTKEEEFEVANFPSQPIQEHSSNFNQDTHSSSFLIQQSPQQPSFFIATQPTTSPSPNTSQHQYLQPQQHIVSIDITSPASLSPQPQQPQHRTIDTSMATTMMQHENQGIQLSDAMLPFDSNTTFSNLLNQSEEVNFDDVLMEEDMTPIRTDIFLSDSIQHLQ